MLYGCSTGVWANKLLGMMILFGCSTGVWAFEPCVCVCPAWGLSREGTHSPTIYKYAVWGERSQGLPRPHVETGDADLTHLYATHVGKGCVRRVVVSKQDWVQGEPREWPDSVCQ